VDPAQFLTAPRVTIVAGKGGVGKTAVSATLALAASRLGLSCLVIDVDGRAAVAALMGIASDSYDSVELVAAGPDRGRVTARVLTPDDALVEYLRDHGLKRLSNRLVSSGAIDMVATATPGIRDVLVLGKIKQLERSAEADVIIVDAPAAGHAISFLRSASGLLDAVSVGPIEAQAREVVEMLADPDRCQVVLVALPEETPVNELVDTAFSLEEHVGIRLGPVVVNAVMEVPAGLEVAVEAAVAAAGASLDVDEIRSLRTASSFVAERGALHQIQVERLAGLLPLPQIRLPFRFTAELGRNDLEVMVDRLLADIESLPEDA